MTPGQLQKLRKTARLTQFELSRESGIDRPRLSYAEHGHVQLTQEEVEEIRRVVAKLAAETAENVRRALELNQDSALQLAQA